MCPTEYMPEPHYQVWMVTNSVCFIRPGRSLLGLLIWSIFSAQTLRSLTCNMNLTEPCETYYTSRSTSKIYLFPPCTLGGPRQELLQTSHQLRLPCSSCKPEPRLNRSLQKVTAGDSVRVGQIRYHSPHLEEVVFELRLTAISHCGRRKAEVHSVSVKCVFQPNEHRFAIDLCTGSLDELRRSHGPGAYCARCRRGGTVRITLPDRGCRGTRNRRGRAPGRLRMGTLLRTSVGMRAIAKFRR